MSLSLYIYIYTQVYISLSLYIYINIRTYIQAVIKRMESGMDDLITHNGDITHHCDKRFVALGPCGTRPNTALKVNMQA